MPISAAGNSPVRRRVRAGTPARRGAEHGFTPPWRCAEHGFTLVELMVVLVVIALASAAVAFAIPDPRGRLVDEAARFAGRVRAAHDAAIVDARPVSLWVSPGGYGFDQRLGSAWAPMAEQSLRVQTWREGTRAGVHEIGGRDRLTFDETGLADRPLDIALTRGRYAAHVRVAADGSVRVGE